MRYARVADAWLTNGHGERCVEWRSLHFKLPPLKVTFRPTTGKVERKLVYRDEVGRSGSVTAAVEKQNDNASEIPDDDGCHDEAFCEGPTLHTIQNQANSAAWERIGHRLLEVIVEGAAMPPHQLCIKCNDALANLRCQKCHASAFYCKGCFLLLHKSTNIFHTAEEWKVSWL